MAVGRIERVEVTDRAQSIPFLTKLNPMWWLVGPDGWTVPDINNGEPYLPDVKAMWLRRFYWFFARNPLMNFVGYVLGIEDRNATVYGSQEPLLTTLRDASPRRFGMNWAVSIPYGFSFPALGMGALFAALGLLWPGFYLAAVWAFMKAKGPLPYVGWYGPVGSARFEFYLGWRPAAGGFGLKTAVKWDD